MMETLKNYIDETDHIDLEAEVLRSSIPLDSTEKLNRHEAHLERHLYRAMAELGRLQMRRKGENGPPEVRVHLARRFSRKRLLRNEPNKCFIFIGWIKRAVKNSVLRNRERLAATQHSFQQILLSTCRRCRQSRGITNGLTHGTRVSNYQGSCPAGKSLSSTTWIPLNCLISSIR
jgi:hypothetical protein